MAGFTGEIFSPDSFLLEAIVSRTGEILLPTEPGDTTRPIVTILSPGAGTPISRFQALTFQITDNLLLFRRILPVVMFPGLPTLELVHDGEEFTPDYFANSTRTAITGGFQYTILRKNGWVDAPTLIPFAFDIAGNEPA